MGTSYGVRRLLFGSFHGPHHGTLLLMFATDGFLAISTRFSPPQDRQNRVGRAGEIVLYQARPDEPHIVGGQAVAYETPRRHERVFGSGIQPARLGRKVALRGTSGGDRM